MTESILDFELRTGRETLGLGYRPESRNLLTRDLLEARYDARLRVREVVDDMDLMSGSEQLNDSMTSNKAGTPGNQYMHVARLLFVGQTSGRKMLGKAIHGCRVSELTVTFASDLLQVGCTTNEFVAIGVVSTLKLLEV